MGQNILAQFTHHVPSILYWAKGKQEGSAEVDYCIERKGNIIGIEVKSGSSGRLRSLFSFADEVKNHHLMRIYSGPFKKEVFEFRQKKYELTSIPFYLIPRIFEIQEFS